MTYIEETQIYIEMIETIRKQRKISIDQLVDNITSERSYRRYLLKEQDVPLEVLTKLMKALDVSVIDMIIYTLQVAQKPSGVIELLQYTYYDHLALAEPFYTLLKNYQGDKLSLTYIVQYFIALFEYKKNKELDTFKLSTQFLEHVHDIDLDQLEGFSVFILKHIHTHGNNHAIIHDIFLNKQLYFFNILLYCIILDLYLMHYLKDTSFQVETYQKLAIHAYETSHKWLDIYPVYASQFHYAYQFYLIGDQASCEKNLFRFLNFHILTQTEPLDKEKSTLISKMIDTDIQTFLFNYVSSLK